MDQMRENTSTAPINTAHRDRRQHHGKLQAQHRGQRARDEGADRAAAAQAELEQRHDPCAMRGRRHDLQDGAPLSQRDAGAQAPDETEHVEDQERRMQRHQPQDHRAD
jgi:hypothetical protein